METYPERSRRIGDFDALWDYDQPAATEQRFRQMLPEAAANRPYYAELLTQIARAQGLQRHFAAAHRTLDEAERLLNDGTPVARIRYLLERGRVYNSSEQSDAARPLFLEAWELAQSGGQDFHAVDAAHMMAIIEPDADSQLEWNLKALAIAESSAAPRAQKWKGSLYNNIGWTYHDRGDYEQALVYLRQALAEREAAGGDKEVRIARWCVARALRSLGRLEEAYETQRALLAAYSSTGEKSGYVYEELGECLLNMDRIEEARPYFRMAHELLASDPWLAANEGDRLARLHQLGVGP